MKTMQGDACFACSNRSRTREAPTPTNISTKSEPEIEKNGTPASPATARASSVLPVPGGPYRRTPFGIEAPSAWNFFGFSRNSLISCSSSTASSTPATSLKPIFGESGAIRFARDLPKLMTFDPPPCTWFIRKIQKPIRSRNGKERADQCRPREAARPLRVPLHPVGLQQVLELHLRLVGGVVDGRLLAVGELEVDRPVAGVERGRVDLVVHRADRLGGGQLLGVVALRDEVWLASHTSRTITMSGKNALRKKRFTEILKSD